MRAPLCAVEFNTLLVECSLEIKAYPYKVSCSFTVNRNKANSADVDASAGEWGCLEVSTQYTVDADSAGYSGRSVPS